MASNPLGKTFGWNVIKTHERTIQQAQETAQKTVSGLWNPLFEFIDQNQNVFTGNIARTTESYTLEMMNIGAQLNAQIKTGKKLDLGG